MHIPVFDTEVDSFNSKLIRRVISSGAQSLRTFTQVLYLNTDEYFLFVPLSASPHLREKDYFLYFTIRQL